MMYTFGCAYGLPYKMATFHSKKGLFNTVYTAAPLLTGTRKLVHITQYSINYTGYLSISEFNSKQSYMFSISRHYMVQLHPSYTIS